MSRVFIFYLSKWRIQRGTDPAPGPLWVTADAVTVLLISENGTVVWSVLNFDRSAVKRALQDTQTDCHQ